MQLKGNVNQAAQDRLRELRQRLAELEPYPWEPIEAWIASARPLITAHYAAHAEAFLSEAATPKWYYALRVASGGGRWGGPRVNNFDDASAREGRENRKRAAAAQAKILAFVDGLLDLPPLPALSPHTPHDSNRDQTVHHHYGGVTMSDPKFSITNTNSTIGAQAVGDHATATGSVTIGAQGAPTQAQHLENIKSAKKALVDDEEQLGPLLHEALGQFLRMAREIQVDQKSLAETQAKMKETLDDVWAQEAAKGLRSQVLPQGMKIVGELAKSPVMGVVVKALLGA
jgi:hypothetical protein